MDLKPEKVDKKKDIDSFVTDGLDYDSDDQAFGQVGHDVKLNKQEEEDLIRDLMNQAQQNDTLKELDEALMDRTTAQKTLRNKSTFNAATKINSSNFQKSNQQPQ